MVDHLLRIQADEGRVGPQESLIERPAGERRKIIPLQCFKVANTDLRPQGDFPERDLPELALPLQNLAESGCFLELDLIFPGFCQESVLNRTAERRQWG